MVKYLIEVTSIGFSDADAIENAVTFLNQYQETFDFVCLNVERFNALYLKQKNHFKTDEIYDVIDDVLMDLKGIHNFVIGIVKKRLDGERWGNLFGSMQTTENGRLTGKAIFSTHEIDVILKTIPIETYYVFELLSFAIRFIVGRGMIHDGERGCIFHRKSNKFDILNAMGDGHISLESRKQINKHLDLQQINSFTNLLNIISAIVRSDDPLNGFEAYIKQDVYVDEASKKKKVFISYSKADEKWLERMKTHIKPFERKGIVDTWDNTRIEGGMVWKEEIEKALGSAKIAIVLVSASFLASDFIADYELPTLLAAAKKEGTVILPLLVRPCNLVGSGIEQFKPINSNALSGMSEHSQEQMFVRLTKSLIQALQKDETKLRDDF